MSEAKFTRGKWEQDYEGAYHSVWCGNKCIAILHNDGDEDYDESLANSHLIAAAPDMYEMLERVLAEYKEMLGKSPEVNEIEQLLEKARGES